MFLIFLQPLLTVPFFGDPGMWGAGTQSGGAVTQNGWYKESQRSMGNQLGSRVRKEVIPMPQI
jgi:hypothetical protein